MSRNTWNKGSKERARHALILCIQGRTYQSIGHELGISKSRVQQIVRKAVHDVAPSVKTAWRYGFKPTARFIWEMKMAYSLGQRISFMPTVFP